MCEVWRANLKWKNKCAWWINNSIIVLCVPCLLSSVHEMDCLSEKTVPVPGRFGAQSSVASTRWWQFKERVCWMWVIFPALLLTPDKYSSWRVGRVVPMIHSAVQTTLHSLLRSRFVSWAEPDSYWCAEDGFNDGRVELYQQLLWQVELPQLVKEVQPLLGLFHNGLNVIAPL